MLDLLDPCWRPSKKLIIPDFGQTLAIADIWKVKNLIEFSLSHYLYDKGIKCFCKTVLFIIIIIMSSFGILAPTYKGADVGSFKLISSSCAQIQNVEKFYETEWMFPALASLGKSNDISLETSFKPHS